VRKYDPAGPIKGEYTGYSYGIGGGVPLLNLSAIYQLSAAAAGIESAESGLQTAHQDLIVRLFDAYLGCLKAYADEKLYRNELDRIGKVLAQAEAYLKAGTGDIIAVYEARARLDAAAADLVKAEGQIRLARQKLASLTGIDPESVVEIAPANYNGPEPPDLEWWLTQMRQRNPLLEEARKSLRQAEEGSRAAFAAHYPTLSANGGYTVDKGSTFLPDVATEQWYVGASLSIPIYSGGDTTARTQRALAGESDRRAALSDTEERAVGRLKESFLKLQHNVSILAAYKRKYESAEMQLKAVQKGREIGTRTAIDLLNAEGALALSLRDLTSSRYDVIMKQIELKASAGILGEEDIVSVGRQGNASSEK
jgi:outer membrane protein